MFTVIKNNSELISPKYRADIDGLRAIAVLSVVGFHAFGITGGFSGVDVFFVISGFLISTIIFENLEKGSFSLNEFYQRRIRRIFPSLLLVLIACLIFGWFVLFSDEYQQLGKHVAAGAGFISNFILWSESGYFDTAGELKPLLHLWSLGVEEQFYFVWPIFAWLLWKFRGYLVWVTLVIAAISFGANVWLVGTNSIAVFYSPLTRFWELLAGSCLAYAVLYDKNNLSFIKKQSSTLSCIGFIFIVGGFVFLTKNFLFPGWWAIIPVLGTILLLATGPNTWVAKNILSNSILRWFGLISFPLYLWHWPLLTFVRILSGYSRTMKICSIIASIFLAWISYQLPEKFFRNGKHPNIKSVALLAIMVLVGTCGFIVYSYNGFESRIDDGHQGKMVSSYRAQLSWPEKYIHSDECLAKYGPIHYCMIGDISKPPTVALIGDSHANHFFPGLNHYFQSNGENLILLGAGGCPPLFEMDRLNKPPLPNFKCYKQTSAAYKFILSDKNIKMVFLSFHHVYLKMDSFVYKDNLQQIQFKNTYQATLEGLTRTIQMLENTGKEVVLIYDLPDFSGNIVGCFVRRPFFEKNNNECNSSPIRMIKDFDTYDKLITSLKKNTHVKIFDTRPYVAGNFPIDADGNLNYRDYTHLSYQGSLYFSNKYSFDR